MTMSKFMIAVAVLAVSVSASPVADNQAAAAHDLDRRKHCTRRAVDCSTKSGFSKFICIGKNIGRYLKNCPADTEYVHIDNAFKNGHCGGSAEKTTWVQLSILNGLFGGNSNPPQDSFSFTGRDCTAWCVKNSENNGKGSFKYNPSGECFQYRPQKKCGTPEEQAQADAWYDELCEA